MTDTILAEMQKIKEANGKRYASLEAMARSLGQRERLSAREGRQLITIPAQPKAKRRTTTRPAPL